MRNIKRIALPLLLSLPLCAVAANPVKISGLMQVDASISKDYQQHRTSDVILRKIELGLDSQINEKAAMHMLLEHGDGDSGMLVTEGNITLLLTRGWYLAGGKMVVPFGVFETNMISDTLTKPLGEAHEDAVLIGYGGEEGTYFSIYTYNGDTIKTGTALKGDNTEGHYGSSVGYILKKGELSLDIGADYTNSIADADTFYDGLTLNTDTDGDTQNDTATLKKYVSGIALHTIYSNGPWSAFLEHLKSNQFRADEMSFKGTGAAPSATNIEGAYGFNWGTLAIAHQTTSEALAIGVPERRIVGGATMGIYDDTTLKIEYAKDRDYGKSVGGTGKSSNTLTFQLSVTF